MNHCFIIVIDSQTVWTAASAIALLVFACLALTVAARRT